MTVYSVFDLNGQNIESKTFSTLAEAEAHLTANDYEVSARAGQNCDVHDELEHGMCTHCKSTSTVDDIGKVNDAFAGAYICDAAASHVNQNDDAFYLLLAINRELSNLAGWDDDGRTQG